MNGQESDSHAQLAIARCAFALSTRNQETLRKQHWQIAMQSVTDVFEWIRKEAVTTVQFLTKIDPSFRDATRPLLRERSLMDDSKAVRDAADQALKSME